MKTVYTLKDFHDSAAFMHFVSLCFREIQPCITFVEYDHIIDPDADFIGREEGRIGLEYEPLSETGEKLDSIIQEVMK